eukprot:gene9098-16223_t
MVEEPKANEGRKGSLIHDQYMRGERVPKPGVPLPEMYPSNEEVAKAVQQKVAAAVEMSRKYRHVAWQVPTSQASAYQSGEVVQTLKEAFMPPGISGTSMTFQTEEDVLNYLGSQVLAPIWKDPICGDNKCEWPWEFPAWGRFGCKADCGSNDNTTKVVINVQADFTGNPSISPNVLMNNAKWNLFTADQVFAQVQVNSLNSMDVIDGKWYVLVKGDYAGRVAGSVFDISDNTNPVPIVTEPKWEACKLSTPATSSATTTAVRRLLQAYTHAHKVGGDEGKEIIEKAVADIQAMPELKHINFTQAGLGGGSGAGGGQKPASDNISDADRAAAPKAEAPDSGVETGADRGSEAQELRSSAAQQASSPAAQQLSSGILS